MATKARVRLDGADSINAGLVGFWPLHDASLSRVHDISGYRRHGSLVNPQGRRWGPNGLSYVANNPNELANLGGDGGVTVGSDLGLGGLSGLMAVSLWVFNPAATGAGTFFKIGRAASGGNGDGWAIGMGSTTLDASGSNIVALYEDVRWIATGVALPEGWHHVAMSLNVSGYPVIYLDGRQIYSDTTGAPRAIGSRGATFTTLNVDWGASRYFTGRYQNVRVWRRDLKPTEVARLCRDPWAGTARPVRRGYGSVIAPITAEGAFTFADMTIAGEATYAAPASTGVHGVLRRRVRRRLWNDVPEDLKPVVALAEEWADESPVHRAVDEALARYARLSARASVARRDRLVDELKRAIVHAVERAAEADDEEALIALL